jgi:hypothetical protein
MPNVRITAYPAHWLTCREGFAYRKRITWSTGESAQAGDIQVFAVSATLGEAKELADDPRRDAVHSIWKLLTAAGDAEGSDRWPTQARLSLLVLLDTPVPKADLLRAGLLKAGWPQGYAGKLVERCRDIIHLADVLAWRNPKQRGAIEDALYV